MTEAPPPPRPDSTETAKKAVWKRWWFWLGAVLVLLVAIAALPDDAQQSAGDVAASPTSAPAAETPDDWEATEPPEFPEPEEAEPSPTPEEPKGWETIIRQGSGDDVVKLRVPGFDPAVLEVEHNGGSNFAVVTYDGDGEYLELLVNDIGNYRGSVPINFLVGENVTHLEITASGAWKVTAKPLSEAREIRGQGKGSGDEVVLIPETSGLTTMTVNHSGRSNFAILAYGDDRDLLVNEIGRYSGKVRVPPGSVVLVITADGEWSVKFN